MTALIIILLIIVALAAFIFIPQFLLRQAVGQVIRIFRKQNATTPLTARTAEELQLQQKSYFQRMMGRRDYKPYALEALVKAGIVKTAENARLFLSEETLAESPLGKRIKPPRPY